MDSVCVFFLLLLGSLSAGDEIQNNELLEQSQSRAEAVNVETPQPCLSDVHAVLRDLSVKLALLQTKVEALDHLQTKVEALDHLPTKVEALDHLPTKVEALDRQQAKLQMESQGQAAELKSVKTWANVTESHVDSLWRDRTVGRVAFSAALSSSALGHYGPFNTDVNLVFRHVFSNIGKAYNPSTGMFTAPVRGIYTFDVHSLVVGSTGVKVWLVKNEEQVLCAEAHPPSGLWGAAANSATLQLEVGDVIFLRLHRNHRIYDNDEQNTFSGRLLFPL